MRGVSFIALLVGCCFVAIAYVAYRARLSHKERAPSASYHDNVTSKAGEAVGVLPSPPYVMFRHTALDEAYGRLGVISLATQNVSRSILPLRCERVHFSVDRGVCLTANRGVFTTYKAIVFNSDLQRLHEFPLNGFPSRVRVAPDGRVAAITVFVSGHSYGAASFSTLVTFIDLYSGAVVVENMESFTVLREGQPVQAADFNFWGVTFTRESNAFYATLGTGGQNYLVKGDVLARTVQVLHEGVECPSLSPDNSRIAFKKRIEAKGERVTWRLAVLDLETLQERLLAEPHDVDDQAEWLDNRQILYYLPDRVSAAVTNTWVVQADGQGIPRLFMPQAYSLTVVRREDVEQIFQ